MLQTVSRRLAALTLVAGTAGAAALSGCGSDTSASASDSPPSATSADGAQLLREAFKSSSMDSTTGGAVTMDLKGSVEAPKDKDLQALAGEAKLAMSVKPAVKGQSIPPLAVTFSAKGTDKDGEGKPGSGDYKGGFTYVDNQFYANWDGKDYAAGKELTQKGLDLLNQQYRQDGLDPSSPSFGIDEKKVMAALDLDPGTWLKSPTVTDGGTIDGVDTQKVSGAVDVKAVADDVTDALHNLPSVLPKMRGVDELKKLKGLSGKDLKEADDAIQVLNASVWVGKDDHRQRQIQLDLKFDDQTDDDPASGNLSLLVTTSTKPTDFSAPKNPAPITDLFLTLQQQFGGPNGPFSGMFSEQPKTA